MGSCGSTKPQQKIPRLQKSKFAVTYSDFAHALQVMTALHDKQPLQIVLPRALGWLIGTRLKKQQSDSSSTHTNNHEETPTYQSATVLSAAVATVGRVPGRRLLLLLRHREGQRVVGGCEHAPVRGQRNDLLVHTHAYRYNLCEQLRRQFATHLRNSEKEIK